MPGTTKSHQAYDAIERMITFQELRPGTLVSESMLMNLTNLGRTPIRESLQRLSQERMVEIHPSRGVLIPPMSIEEQLKLLELRRELECFTVGVAAQRRNDLQKQQMCELAEELSADHIVPSTFAVLLRRIHEITVAATGNEYISVAMAPLQGLSRRFWFAHLTNPEKDVKTASKLHKSVLEAICKADAEMARSASLRHNDYLLDFAYGTLRRPQ